MSNRYGNCELIDSPVVNHTLRSESDVIDDIINNIQPDGVFYDIGACHGSYACIVASEYPDCDVHAFEPHPASMYRVSQNMDMNDTIFNTHLMAIGGHVGDVKLDCGSGPAVHRLSNDPSGDTIPVQQSTLDSFVSLHAFPTVIKIDVEGAECDVVQGGIETLSDDRLTHVYIEIHYDDSGHSPMSNYGGTEQKIFDILYDAGFSVQKMNERPATYHIKATR